MSKAATLANIPSYSFMRNRVINGDMRIDQRNAGASVTISNAVATYTLDRWQALEDTDGSISVQRVADAPPGFVNSARITVATADSSLGATQRTLVYQPIEGFNISDLAFGTASARPVTLSFWVKSSVTGQFGGALINGPAVTRSYPYSYTVNSANTWEQKTISLSGDTTGTWSTDNAIGLGVVFGLGVGSTYSGTAGAWAAADLNSSTGSTNLLATLNATWQVTGVQLEVGTAATPFERRQYGQELMLCQRYYEVGSARLSQYSSFGTSYLISFRDIKRATPTVAISNIDYYGSGASGAFVTVFSGQGFLAGADWTSTLGYRSFYYDWAASAEL